MMDSQSTAAPTVCRQWSEAVASLLTEPWRLFETQYESGMRIVETMWGAFAQGPPGAGDDLRRLERVSAERVRKGLAPPPEVYRAPYRTRIDWSQFPDWARPTDPELFEGCGHEG
jgi:hypothetical protein